MLKIIQKLVNKYNNLSNIDSDFSQEHCNFTELNEPVKTTVTIPNCVKRLFQKITHELMNVILDEDNFLHAVDNVYENLPFQRKIVLSKDNFKNMMVKMKGEYHENKGVITDQQLEKLIVEAYSTKDLKD